MGKNNKKLRIAAYVDGFNFYHALRDKPKRWPYKRPSPCRKYRWLNLKTIVSNTPFMNRYELKKIYYFTALATWKPSRVKRHQEYIKALKSEGIEIVYGEFKVKDKRITIRDKDKNAAAKVDFTMHEEKRTDINIAVKLLEDAFNDVYDAAIVATGDTDLIPAIQAVKKNFSSKKVFALFPPFRSHRDIKKVVDEDMGLKPKHLKAAQFDDILMCGDRIIAAKPEKWVEEDEHDDKQEAKFLSVSKNC